jgi:pyridoxal phosphate enzyme (YggS family)
MSAEDVHAALGAGHQDFGESYAQELHKKMPIVTSVDHVVPRWHFIGPLQTNKVKLVAGQVALIHSLDSRALLAAIERRMAESGQVQDCLVQVNIVAEPQKRGVAPAELPALLDGFAETPHVRCVGLMLIPPLAAGPEAARPHFAALRRLRDGERARERPHVDLRELSMGMSHDFEVAVAEGATLVRVGTAIFGERPETRA